MDKGSFKNINIILCTHNGDKFLNEQLDSIVNQSVMPNNIYIYDYDSGDNTRLIIQEYQEIHKNIKVTLIPYAHGACSSFFDAIKRTLVKVENNSLFFLSDQDDIWELDKIESQLIWFTNFISNNKHPLVVYHDVSIVDTNLSVINDDYFNGFPNYLPRDSEFNSLIFGNSIIGHTMMVNTEALKILNSFDNKTHYAMHDWTLVLIASLYGNLFYCNKKLTKYRQHESNVLGVSSNSTSFNLVKTYDYSKVVFQQAYSFFQDNKNTIKITKFKFLFSENIHIFRIKLAIYGIIFAPTYKKKILALFFLFNWL